MRTGLQRLFSAAQPYIPGRNGFTNTQTSLITTIRSAAYLLGTFAIGRYYRRIGYRAGCALSAVLVSVSFVLFAAAKRVFAVYYFAGAVAGIGYAFGSMVPASILMRRWFRSHCGLAIGVCAAGTGLATVAFSPLFTSIAEKSGVDHAFCGRPYSVWPRPQSCSCLVRDDPHALGLEPFGKEAQESAQTRALHALHPTRLRWAMVQLAVLLVSGIGATGFTHLMTPLHGRGHGRHARGRGVLAVRAGADGGQIRLRALCDRLGSYRSNYLLFGCFILGYVLCTLAPLRSAALMLASAVFLGFGSSLNTVGISIWAADLSTQERYESVLRQFQAAYGLGGLVMSFLPGAIADLTGSYAPAYAIFAALLAFSLFTLQSTYRLARK